MNQLDLRELERSVRTNVRITTGLVIATIVVVIAAGGYGYWKVNRMLEPENVAAKAERYVESHYPEWRTELKTELVRSAPRLAERFSDRMLARIPEARARVENRLDRWTERGLERAQDVSTDELREFVRQNKADIRQAYLGAKQSPEDTRAAVNRWEEKLKTKYDVNTRKEAREALAWIDSFNERLREIAKESDPATESEEAERRIARLLRAMEKEGPQVPVALNRPSAHP